MTENCLLASKCKGAGTVDWCDTLCYGWAKLHGESGTGGIWATAEIPKAYARAMVGNIPFNRDNSQAAIAVTEYCKDVSRKVAEGIGFYFFSVPDKANPKGTGNGKTTAACTILNEFIVVRTIEHMQQKRLITVIPAFFVNVSKFQNTYNKQFRGTRNMQEEASRDAPHIIEGRVLPRIFKDALVLLLEEVEKNEELTQENTHLRGTVEIMALKVEAHDHILCKRNGISFLDSGIITQIMGG